MQPGARGAGRRAPAQLPCLFGRDCGRSDASTRRADQTRPFRLPTAPFDVSARCRRAVPVPPSAKGQPAVIPVALPELAAFSSLRVYIPQDLRTPVRRVLLDICGFLRIHARARAWPSLSAHLAAVAIEGRLQPAACLPGRAAPALLPPPPPCILHPPCAPCSLPPPTAGGAGAVRQEPRRGGAPLPKGPAAAGPAGRHEDRGATGIGIYAIGFGPEID